VTYQAADLERIFAEQLTSIATALAAIHAEFMLIGGIAVGVWSEPRATKDCDLSVRVLVSTAELRAALETAGLEVARGDLARAQAAGEAVRLRRHGCTDEPIVVDLLFATTPFEIAALGRRQPLTVLGVELPVVGPEDLFVFKLIAGRPQDLADAHRLFELHGSTFDLVAVRGWCREFSAEERLDTVLRSSSQGA
jgi:hypothetical protein